MQRARGALGPDMAGLNNGDLAAQIVEEAKSHGFVVPGRSAPVRPGDREVVDRLKKLFASIPTDVKWVGPGGDSVAINVSGFTATVNSGQTRSTLSLGWDQAIAFKTQTSCMTVSASIGPH